MIFVTRHILTIGCILISCCPVYVPAVTDAELEALEKQIDQQEAESKRKAEEESRRKAEAEARRKAEEEKRKADEMRTAELEQQRLEEEKRKAEEARVAKQERLRWKEERKERAKKEKQEKYTLLIQEAEEAVNNRDKKLAIAKFTEALSLVPGDSVANTGIKEAEKLMDKDCYKIIGDWTYMTRTMNIKPDGSMAHTSFLGTWDGTWKCLDPEGSTFYIAITCAGCEEWRAELKENGNCLSAFLGGAGED